jgi:hypothetical protein
LMRPLTSVLRGRAGHKNDNIISRPKLADR